VVSPTPPKKKIARSFARENAFLKKKKKKVTLHRRKLLGFSSFPPLHRLFIPTPGEKAKNNAWSFAWSRLQNK
jgi:hypothetical protein